MHHYFFMHKSFLTTFVIIHLLLFVFVLTSPSYAYTSVTDSHATYNNSNYNSSNNNSHSYTKSSCNSGTCSSYYGALEVNGSDLCDSNGYKIQLKGISTHGIHWFPQYINRDCFKYFRDNWGCNLIRLAMYTDEGGYTSSSYQASNMTDLIINGADICTELNMYCIIDWHILNDGNPLQHVNESIQFFDAVSSRYKDTPNIIYEICNEPNGNATWSDIKLYAEQIIPVIRANAPDAIILIGTPFWSQRVDVAADDPLRQDLSANVMYTLHFYAATHKEDLQNKLLYARASGLPIFISEFSTCDASGNGNVDYNSALQWFNIINDNNLSYAGWNLSNKNESSAILRSDVYDYTGNYNDNCFTESGILLKTLMSR